MNFIDKDSYIDLKKSKLNDSKLDIIKGEDNNQVEDYTVILRDSGIINDDKINIEKKNEKTEKNLKGIQNNKDIFKIITPFKKLENPNKDLTINSIFFNPKIINNNTNNDNYIYINDNIEKKKEGILIGQKRMISPKAFIIFNKGGNDNYISQLIKESLQNNKKYFFSQKSTKERKERKEGDDNIRKKIKTRFFKALKNKVNEKLSLVGSKKLFNYLQQEFIINMNKEINKGWLDLT